MSRPWHPGELAAQERAGFRREADSIGAGVRPSLPPPAADFLAVRRLLVVAAEDADGALWATPLTGPPGFVRPLSPARVVVEAQPPRGDPLARALTAGAAIGTIAIDPTTQRRARLNGHVVGSEARGFVVQVRQVFSNCRKHLQLRVPLPDAPGEPTFRDLGRLTDDEEAWLRQADHVFLASAAHGGVDASHRGGAPGFVTVEDGLVTIPDYAGNRMLMTLGNLEANPRAGLTAIDPERGRVLQLSGRADVDWRPGAAAAHPGAERLVRLHVERAVVAEQRVPLRWRLIERSRHDPELGRSAIAS
jgi:predicted pyridoxine 5'-phosphate oxidase superfamily flavin-nucleotide-binding protein